MTVRSDLEQLPEVIALFDRIATAETEWVATLSELELTQAFVQLNAAILRAKRARVQIGFALDAVDRRRRARVS